MLQFKQKSLSGWFDLCVGYPRRLFAVALTLNAAGTILILFIIHNIFQISILKKI